MVVKKNRKIKKSTKRNLFILFNSIIVISTLVITIIDIIHGTNGGQNNLVVQGWDYFMPFTVKINILMAVASFVALVKLFRHKKNTRKKLYSQRFTDFYFVSTVSLNLVAATVLLFLAPVQFINGENGLSMFSGDMLFFHLINPILAVCSLAYLFDGVKISKVAKFFCYVPTIIYSTIYGIHVVVLHDWIDFYNFTFDGNYFWTTVFAVACGIAIYAISTFFAKTYNKRILAH